MREVDVVKCVCVCVYEREEREKVGDGLVDGNDDGRL